MELILRFLTKVLSWPKAGDKWQKIFCDSKKYFGNKSYKYDISVSILSGIVASLIVAIAGWWFVSRIDPDKVILCLRYAYEYKYEKATQEDPVRKIIEDVPINMSSSSNGQNLWFAVVNTNINSVDNLTLHLHFQDGLSIKSNGEWQEHLPNRNYTYVFYGSLNNGLVIGTFPLNITFPTKSRYEVTYSMTAKGIKPKTGRFFIESN